MKRPIIAALLRAGRPDLANLLAANNPVYPHIEQPPHERIRFVGALTKQQRKLGEEVGRIALYVVSKNRYAHLHEVVMKDDRTYGKASLKVEAEFSKIQFGIYGHVGPRGSVWAAFGVPKKTGRLKGRRDLLAVTRNMQELAFEYDSKLKGR